MRCAKRHHIPGITHGLAAGAREQPKDLYHIQRVTLRNLSVSRCNVALAVRARSWALPAVERVRARLRLSQSVDDDLVGKRGQVDVSVGNRRRGELGIHARSVAVDILLRAPDLPGNVVRIERTENAEA